ncbi:MAG: LPS assembly protein LptD, partial [Pseudomonadota bacterium]
VYNRRSGVAAASGNVVVVDEDGNVLFAEYAELEEGLAQGFIEQANILFADESRIVANSGVRQEGRRTIVDRAVYSPCLLCVTDPDKPPIWQVRAAQVTHDSERKVVTYRDAFFDFYGVPVLYTPYFSHVDPSVERRTGILTPRFGSTNAMGPFLRNYFYVDISPEQDATIEATLTRDSGILVGAEYRRRFENGRIELTGALNRSDRTDQVGDVEVVRENENRGYLFGEARFDLNENWRTGADIALVSDDTFLRTFEISDEDVLRNTGFAEGFYGPSYFAIEAFSFRDLRLEGQRQPVILPLATADLVTEPDALLGGQGQIRASALNVRRDTDLGRVDSDINDVDTRRLSVEAAWLREDISSTGLVTNLETSVRADVYDSNDIPDPNDATAPLRDETAARLIPRATIGAKYPFARNGLKTQQIIEPVISFTAAPSINNGTNVPNNDSRDLEFDDVNLFDDNRFPGIDFENGGARVAYGLGFSHFAERGEVFEGFLGQSVRLIDDEELPVGSGLEDDRSDLVGRLTYQPGPQLNLAWRFRLDDEDLTARRHEVLASTRLGRLNASATYTFLDAIADSDSEIDREELRLAGSWKFNDRWRATGSLRRDLEANESRDASIGLIYADCCLTFTAQLRRDFTRNRNTNEGTSIFFTLGLQNLGQLPFSLENTGF